jgi:hypothetical protein
VTFTAVDSLGLPGTATLVLLPETVPITITTSPSGLIVTYDGVAAVTPFTRSTAVNARHTLFAPSPQDTFVFQGWGVSGSPLHDVVITSPTTLSAVYGAPASYQVSTGYLSDQVWLTATNGWGPVERNRSNGENQLNDGRRLAIGGATFEKGLGVNAYSEIAYELGDRCLSFSAEIGVDDEVGTSGSVIFQVMGDDRLLFQSGILRGGSAPQPIVVDVTKTRRLRLIVLDGGDGGWQDHANWANASVSCYPTQHSRFVPVVDRN